MNCDLTSYDKDVEYITTEFARWWKLPSEAQVEAFLERVSIMVESDEMSVDEARKIAIDRIIYR